MLLDDILPRHHFNEVHSVTIRASPECIFQALQRLTLTDLPLFRLLWQLRGMGKAKPLAEEPVLHWAVRAGFAELAIQPEREIVLGRIGKFWNLRGDDAPALRTLDEFLAFKASGYARTAMNFYMQPEGNSTILSTETRVFVPDAAARMKFRNYWFLIRPWSGAIRKEILRIVKRHAETEVRSKVQMSTM